MTLYRWGFDMVDVNSVDALSWNSIGPDVVILREEADAMPPQFYFSSQHFNDLEDESEVVARGQQLKTLFDGALLLEQGYGYRAEKMYELWRMDRFARLGFPSPAGNVSTFSPEHCRKPLSRTEQAAIEKNFVDMALYVARTDKVVHDILVLLGVHGITFSSLYSLTDTMTTNGFDIDKQWQAAGVDKDDYRNFKHTANSAAVLGPLARHGQKKHQPPSKPTTIEEAAGMVLAATRVFMLKRMRRTVAQKRVADIAMTQTSPSQARPADPPIENAPKVSVPVEAASADIAVSTPSRNFGRWIAAALIAAPIGIALIASKRKSK